MEDNPKKLIKDAKTGVHKSVQALIEALRKDAARSRERLEALEGEADRVGFLLECRDARSGRSTGRLDSVLEGHLDAFLSLPVRP